MDEREKTEGMNGTDEMEGMDEMDEMDKVNEMYDVAERKETEGIGEMDKVDETDETDETDDMLLVQEMTKSPIGEKTVIPGMPELARQSAAEGCVLLKNEGALPFTKEQVISVFGRCQADTFFVGYGSGGDVHPPYKVSFLEGLEQCERITLNRGLADIYRNWCAENPPTKGKGWGKWPMCYPEMPLSKELVAQAAGESDVALLILGRAAGEERENVLEKGSYYLTDEEEEMLSLVTTAFEQTVVVLNCGNVIDMAWTKKYEVQGLLCSWLGGMEAGNALADVLCGRVNPCGRLSDTIADSYDSYPGSEQFGGLEYNFYEEDIFLGYRYFETFAKRNVLFPFGFGLSYSNFYITPVSFEKTETECRFTVRVVNGGPYAGKEVVQIYVSAPQGKLGKAAKSLVAFGKTEVLEVSEEQELTLSCPLYALASYDDTGKTGHASAYVLEAGTYRFFVGKDVEYCAEMGSFVQKELVLLEQLQPVCMVKNSFKRYVAKEENGIVRLGKEVVPPGEDVLKERILEELPEEIPVTGDRGLRFLEVVDGTVSLEDFIAQLSDEELEGLTRGEAFMNSSLGVEGNTGVFGGVLPSLREKGVPPLITADGPAGLRVRRYTTLLPCGTTLACTWNTTLVESLFGKIGEEMARHGVDVMLSPGLNLHRNPLCGRNFEYYSEDPLLSGKTAAAAVRGIQKHGSSACPKHFAANNQETGRNQCDSRVSERALRELYFKGFEICVKEAKPRNLMTSYNRVNGVWSHYNYDLVTTVLRGEWNYQGNVMTDWWMRKSESPEFPQLRDNAYRVRAQVDVLMPGGATHLEKTYRSDGTLLETLGKDGGITRAELQRTAKNVLRFAAEIKKSV